MFLMDSKARDKAFMCGLKHDQYSKSPKEDHKHNTRREDETRFPKRVISPT